MILSINLFDEFMKITFQTEKAGDLSIKKLNPCYWRTQDDGLGYFLMT
jgi:hypothetical protein